MMRGTLARTVATPGTPSTYAAPRSVATSSASSAVLRPMTWLSTSGSKRMATPRATPESST